jgi:hypothetical protein
MKLTFFDNDILTKSYGVSIYIEKESEKDALFGTTHLLLSGQMPKSR